MKQCFDQVFCISWEVLSIRSILINAILLQRNIILHISQIIKLCWGLWFLHSKEGTIRFLFLSTLHLAQSSFSLKKHFICIKTGFSDVTGFQEASESCSFDLLINESMNISSCLKTASNMFTISNGILWWTFSILFSLSDSTNNL